MKKVFLSLTFIAPLFFLGCEEKNNGKQNVKAEIAAPITTSSDSNPKAKVEISESNSLNLLQGKWQSIDDSTNYLVFEGNHKREIAEGMEEWDDEEFTISDICQNESDKEKAIKAEKDKFISSVENDMCWHIAGLDSSYLELTYVARGNSTTYKRVK